jgi:hypothetical protein
LSAAQRLRHTAVPDLPGCFSAGDTLDEAIPVPTDMDALVADHAYAGWILAAVMIDPALNDFHS